jgi:excisionase family DNA binding protein
MGNMAREQDYLSTAEVAKLLKVTDSRVRHLIRDGVLPAKKWGRDWWILEGDLDAYLRRPPKKVGRPRNAP